ncbi:SDR family oxidoreductase [Synechococcus sp. CS-1325]|uniref:SDR family oxidoreductase n=1 Tax=unclassified Synechococcus TaxID=2626047 RepID=UPI000DB36714|nr:MULTISPECIES: SDR family oxidoreductase [unclassified Synechococcus]MCT0200218.1 SDR family oxidoreductase [Synechococcus sp. CS-1325]MCT0213177.1 SDR family oxidoreductase [Synechococcus sp. CS-1326]MCT0233338.1 SDR family oxidoreductase [Synechococcus sp. CS-1327]PZU96603.1 MAG: NADH-flavin reductase [Cyanobium sp.]
MPALSAPGLLAVTGASGKTGWRVVQEALGRGYEVRAILRPNSTVPAGLEGAELIRLELSDKAALERALQGAQALVIATGARPSIDLSGPLQVDALAMRSQIAACQAAGVQRVVLVSSLCSGRFFHPLNLFGLILLWKRLGERWLQESGLAWTVVRPGGLKESELNLEAEGIRFSGPDQQESNSIPRRLVARVCLDALAIPAATGRIIEITSGPDLAPIGLEEWLQSQPLVVDA